MMASISSALHCTLATDYPTARLLQDRPLTAAQNIVLLVIDGLGYNYLTKRVEDSFLAQYSLGKLTSVCPSTTASAIPTFLTGLAPQQHGFTGWFTYFRELGCVTAVLPFKPRASVGSLAESGLTPLKLSGAKPLMPQVEERACNVVMPDWIAESPFNLPYNGQAKVRSYSHLKGLFRSIKASTSSKKKQYVYAYWPHYDTYSHTYGVGSDEVHDHFREIDEGVAKLAASLSGSDTVLLVTADHGFIDTSEERTIHMRDHPELQNSLMLPLCGEARLPFCYVKPGRERNFKDYVASELGGCMDVVSSDQLLEEGWFGQGAIYPPVRDRIGQYTLFPKENYKFKDWVLGEREYRHIGVHGGVSSDEMYVPLIYCEL